MYIEPNSIIKILTRIPLDNNYENTLYWSTAQDQYDYFHNSNHVIRTYDRQSYQRVEKGRIRVYENISQIYSANYLCFINQNLIPQQPVYENKWYYAFITKVEYINDNVTQLDYEIDVLQTWYFDYTLNPCLVEREHSVTDAIGDNLVPENLTVDEYVSNFKYDLGLMNNKTVIVYATFEPDGDSFKSAVINGVFTGLCPIPFDIDDTNEETAQTSYDKIVTFLTMHPIKIKDGIVNISYVPREFAPQILDLDVPHYYWSYTPASYNKIIPSTMHDLNGYTPHNNKLFTHPYNFLYCTNNQGATADYKYEYFSDYSHIEFKVTGDINGVPLVFLIPKNYKGIFENSDEKLSIGNFPQCSWNSDVYMAWLAQTASTILPTAGAAGIRAREGIVKSQLMAEVLKTKVSNAVATAAGAVAELTLQAKAAEIVGQGMLAATQPPQNMGTQSTSALMSCDLLDFTFYRKSVRAEQAQIIDEYFDMYGYACHKVKVPNIHARSKWTYTKTSGCQVNGSLPNDDRTTIESIFNNGIRFWVNPSEVCNYALASSNIPLGVSSNQ